MSLESTDLNVLLALVFVALDESSLVEAVQGLVHVPIVVRQDLVLDPLRPVGQPPSPVRLAPQPLEQQPVQGRQVRQILVGEEVGLDGADPHPLDLLARRRNALQLGHGSRCLHRAATF